jgi:A/G-specific adenine glycosylase
MPLPKLKSFIDTVWTYYHSHGRHYLPWRHTKDPYSILVSEIMLQQTQVERVIPKYHSFLHLFPSSHALSRASTKSVLQEWQGLGYYHRALRLQKTAKIIETQFQSVFPSNYQILLTLPGIGPTTAGDLLAFAWNQPTVIIETNIRSVFIHHFFNTSTSVSDSQIIPYIEKSLDRNNPRKWYWALMDYGAFLKTQKLVHNSQSRHYRLQSPFEGSNRQLRSSILKLVLERGPLNQTALHHHLGQKHSRATPSQINQNLTQLVSDGLIHHQENQYFVP